jgi:hypothetical protein
VEELPLKFISIALMQPGSMFLAIHFNVEELSIQLLPTSFQKLNYRLSTCFSTEIRMRATLFRSKPLYVY